LKKSWLLQSHKRKLDNNRACASGFLLFELLLVITIMSIGYVAVHYAYHKMYAARALKSEVETLCAWCRSLHIQAQTDTQLHQITFDTMGQRYAVDGVWHSFEQGVCFGGRYTTDQIMGPPSNPQHALTSFVTFPSSRIVLRPDGTTSAGVVYLGHRNRTQLYALAHNVNDPFFIRLYRFDGRRWNSVDRLSVYANAKEGP